MRWIYARTTKARIDTVCVAMSLIAAVMTQSAMAATTVPASVMDEVLAGNAQDLIVLFETAKAAPAVPKLRTATRVEIVSHNDDGNEHDDNEDEDAAEILAHKVKHYRKIKARALHAIGTSGISAQQDYTYLPMIHVRVENLAALQNLLSNADVVAVYVNTAHQHALLESLPFIGQPSAQSLGKTGAGTTVAVLDTGINYTLAEFGACTSPGLPAGCRVPVAIDFAIEDNLLDDSGHGTNVAAIVAAVAPGTRIAALDIYTSGYTFTADIIAAINWSIANQALYNIVAINLSLGDGADNAIECPGSWATAPFADARAAGILH
ncbi:MAG: S8 family serine peptidase [Gammaproteobacteria bacterium]|nr:S8 family serine peptidase [Gammaproteobacteria bacterium]